ncbi:PAS domain S-box protein [Runella sp. CRIBMP]|uniref:PAS domain S-box protein n=1 Tax=Runella sp. CRIBMP TaxID=2683261 RepID=UPI001E34B43A|nr:PAS domain S-box protein [Runella sp. CRIBMP]
MEKKALQLSQANEQLRHLNENLKHLVKQGIEELHESEKRYRELLESVQDIIYKISPDGYFTFVKSVVKLRLGYSENELIGRHFADLIVPEYRKIILKLPMVHKADGTFLVWRKELPIHQLVF